MTDTQMIEREDVETLRAEIASLKAALDAVMRRDPNLSVAHFVVSDYEAGLPVAQSTLSAAQRALGLAAVDDEEDDD